MALHAGACGAWQGAQKYQQSRRLQQRHKLSVTHSIQTSNSPALMSDAAKLACMEADRQCKRSVWHRKMLQ